MTDTITINRAALVWLSQAAADRLEDLRYEMKQAPHHFDHSSQEYADELAAHIADATAALDPSAAPEQAESAAAMPEPAPEKAESAPAPTCSACGSDDIRWDAWADHNGDVIATLDYYRCEGCGAEEPPLDRAAS